MLIKKCQTTCHKSYTVDIYVTRRKAIFRKIRLLFGTVATSEAAKATSSVRKNYFFHRELFIFKKNLCCHPFLTPVSSSINSKNGFGFIGSTIGW